VKVSFELSPRDLRHFRDRLRAVRQGEHAHDEETVVKLAHEMVEEALASEPPEFVTVRLGKLETLTAMLLDEEWKLVGRDRARILDALAYFADPDDMIQDRIPGLGYLDDAIMVELIAEELKHDISAYEDFCAFRKKVPKDQLDEKLAGRRKNLQARMRRRRRQQRQAQRSKPRATRTLPRLW
jgi:uncharacterized membrane protein YkvA (DUF1232 family)